MALCGASCCVMTLGNNERRAGQTTNNGHRHNEYQTSSNKRHMAVASSYGWQVWHGIRTWYVANMGRWHRRKSCAYGDAAPYNVLAPYCIGPPHAGTPLCANASFCHFLHISFALWLTAQRRYYALFHATHKRAARCVRRRHRARDCWRGDWRPRVSPRRCAQRHNAHTRACCLGDMRGMHISGMLCTRISAQIVTSGNMVFVLTIVLNHKRLIS